MIRSIASELLGIKTNFDDSRNFNLDGNRLERLLDLVKKTGADCYLSGPAGKNYIDHSRFADIGVLLEWKDYSGYPVYPQSELPFEHGVSVLDVLFNLGVEAPNYIWGWRNQVKTA